MKRAQYHFFIPIFFCYFYATRGGDAPKKIFACPPRPGVRMITHAEPAEIVWGEGGSAAEVTAEFVDRGIDDEVFGEFGGLEEGQEESVFGDIEGYVGIAAEYHGHAVGFAEAQDLEIVVLRGVLMPDGFEAAVVDLEQRVALLGGDHEGFEKEVGGAVAGMAYDVDPGIPDHLLQSGGVLLACAVAVA